MGSRSKLIRRYRILVIAFIVIAIAITAFVLIHELNRMTLERTEEYASLYTHELATLVSSYLDRDIQLANGVATNPRIIAWLQDENNLELKKSALDELFRYNQSFYNKNSFVAFVDSDSVYYTDTSVDPNKLIPESRTSGMDDWYHKAKASELPYTLNIERHALSTAKTLWINVKVYSEGQLIGIVGTGIDLDTFADESSVFGGTDAATTLFINHKGEIQLDSSNQTELTNLVISDFVPFESFANQVESYLNAPKETTLRIKNHEYAYAALYPIEGTNWHILSLVSLESFYNPNRYGLIFSSIVLTIIVLTSAIGISIQRLFIKPFDQLVDSLEKTSMPYSVEIAGLDRKDEFGILANSIKRLSNRLVSSVPVGLFLLDKHGRFVYGNTYFLKQFGVETIEEFNIVFGSDLSLVFNNTSDYSIFKRSIDELLEINFVEAELKNTDRKTFWAEIHLIYHEDEVDQGFEGILLNIQLKKEYERELINLASVDPLTNLYNRRHFDETVKKEILRSERHHHKLSLILFDLDHFKQINDKFGHIIGDEILSDITAIASRCIRSTDTIARWGGEEFSILLPETPIDGAFQVAEKIRLQISDYEHPVVPKITASFGISEYQTDETYVEWFERVDRYLYYAKDSGRNQVYGLKRDFNSIDQLIKLNWHHSFSSGNVIIDEQHKELFNIANAIISNSMKISSESAQRHSIEAFYEYVKKHFEDEANILKEVGYPEDQLKIHVDSHNKLLSRIHAKISKENLTAEEVMKIGMVLIQEVVYEHMIQEDSKYFKYTNPNYSD